MKVSILGESYDIKKLNDYDEVMKKKNYDGYVDFSKKIIRYVADKNVLRHEIIHAFLYESGIDIGTSFHTEESVDYFALQFLKMNEAMKKAGAL